MSKFLSIIIPHYQEKERDLFPLLSSIAGQLGVDFSDIEVILANDGGGAGTLNQDFLSLFDCDIRQVELAENGGPGVARQAGLDAARGEYVMFCDADDALHNVGVSWVRSSSPRGRTRRTSSHPPGSKSCAISTAISITSPTRMRTPGCTESSCVGRS